MTLRPRRLLELLCGGIVLAVVFLTFKCRADGIILHLRNGDRIAGVILSETNNQVTLSNAWASKLVIPMSEIDRRELLTNSPALTSNTNTASTNAPVPPAVVNTNSSSSNAPAFAGKPGVLPPPPPPRMPWYKHWKGEVLVGTSFIRGATDSELYYGKTTVTYSRAYDSDPTLFFRNIFNYVADYGKTAGVLSANDMSGSSKTDFDVNHSFYLYNLGAAGYDEIRLINLHFEDGPGAGYHLFRQTNFIVNVELGGNYQEDDRSDGTTVRSFFYRIAEDINWKITKRLTLVEKYEFFPRADLRQYRWRFESTLSYALLTNISFNLGVVDLYDTSPAVSVPNNEFQFRSTLGVKF